MTWRLTTSPARAAAGWLAVGVALGAAWSWLTPLARNWADVAYERDVAGDVTLAGLEVTVGVVVAVVGLVRAGPGSALRLVVAVVGSAVASLVAWGTGRLLGAPTLMLVGVLVLAPLALALTTVIGTLAATVFVREPYAD